jgi:acyl-CoA synthetase (AMP-forming)/AMP-acid ligase II
VKRVADLIGERCRSTGPALVEGSTGRCLRWSDVEHLAELWASAGPRLAGRGRVGLWFPDPLDQAASFLGALAAGVTVAPLDPAAPGSELTRTVRSLGLGAVVTNPDVPPETLGTLAAAGVERWVAGAGGVELAERPSHPHPGAPGRGAAMVLATSGTSGQPRLIPLQEAQLLHTATSVVEVHRLNGDDCGYSPLPLWHINGLVVGVLGALVGGHRLVVDRRFSASGFWDVVDRHGVTWLNLVPAIISVLAGREPPDASVRRRVRFARSASAPLPLSALRAFEQRTGIPVIETYGMTEAASQITANDLPPLPRTPGSVGYPVGVELRIVDEARRPVPAGVLGQVEIRGPSVVLEYWGPADEGDEHRSARAADGWLPTGDLGRLDEAGDLFLEGRADDVINRGGEKVYPRQVEEVLLADPDVVDAAVVGRPHPTVGAEPVAFLVARPGADPAELLARLHRRCETQLSRFRRPAELTVVDALPTGPNGKIRRAELRRRLAERRPATGL